MNVFTVVSGMSVEIIGTNENSQSVPVAKLPLNYTVSVRISPWLRPQR